MEDHVEFPIMNMAYRIRVEARRIKSLHVSYTLSVGPPVNQSCSISIEGKIEQQLTSILNWCFLQIETPASYEQIGKTINPEPYIEEVTRSSYGALFGINSGNIRVKYSINHPGFGVQGPDINLEDKDIPSEILDLFKQIDETAWIEVKSKIIERLNLNENDIPPYLHKKVFIAYRIHKEGLARRMASYLRSKQIPVWFFPWEIGIGDSITLEEEKGLLNSFSGVIIFTPDLLEGKIAKKEYTALQAKTDRDPDFKICVLRVGASREDLPVFLWDPLDCSIESEKDPAFEDEAYKILRGLRGLPLETP